MKWRVLIFASADISCRLLYGLYRLEQHVESAWWIPNENNGEICGVHVWIPNAIQGEQTCNAGCWTGLLLFIVNNLGVGNLHDNFAINAEILHETS